MLLEARPDGDPLVGEAGEAEVQPEARVGLAVGPRQDALAVELSLRYIQTYEQLTGQTFVPAPMPVDAHLSRALASRAPRP